MITNSTKTSVAGKTVIPTDDSILLLKTADIIFLESNANYSYVYLQNTSCYIICAQLKECEQVLNNSLFLRCHKEYLVNISFLKSRNIYNRTTFELKNGILIPISRRRKPLVNRILKALQGAFIIKVTINQNTDFVFCRSVLVIL